MQIVHEKITGDEFILAAGDVLVTVDRVDGGDYRYYMFVHNYIDSENPYALISLDESAGIQEVIKKNTFNKTEVILDYYQIIEVIPNNKVKVQLS